jgi:hypothetical protein
MQKLLLLVTPVEITEIRYRRHRDDIPATAAAEEEIERLTKPAWHAQWNLALYDDASLIAVPGSHLRARTEQEREAGVYDSLDGQVSVTFSSDNCSLKHTLQQRHKSCSLFVTITRVMRHV